MMYKARIVNDVQVHEYATVDGSLVNTITGAVVDNDGTFTETEMQAVVELRERIKQQMAAIIPDTKSTDTVICSVAKKRIRQYEKYVVMCDKWVEENND